MLEILKVGMKQKQILKLVAEKQYTLNILMGLGEVVGAVLTMLMVNSTMLAIPVKLQRLQMANLLNVILLIINTKILIGTFQAHKYPMALK